MRFIYNAFPNWYCTLEKNFDKINSRRLVV